MTVLRLRMFGLLLSLCLPLLLIAAEYDQASSPPLTPSEFHNQEFARIRRGLENQPIASSREVQDDFDVTYYDLKLDIRDYANQRITGIVTTHGRALTENFDQVLLDLCATLAVDSILSEGVQLSFLHASNILTINLNRSYAIDELFAVKVFYHGTPCETSSFPSFSYTNRYTISGYRPTIYTLSEPYGARDWWPCKNTPADKADSARISITVADTIVATSNGILESLTPLAASSRTYTWFEKHPIASYLICISATNYAHWRDWYVSVDGDSMPIDNYSYPEKLAQAQISWNVIPQVVGILEDLFGEFPFLDEKYGHTMFSWASGRGAMEHQCNTSYGYYITNGAHTYDYIVVHEAAHQWWGDEVTLRTWPDIWLNEGFASYSEALWKEHQAGFASYKSYMATTSGLGVTDPSGPIYDPAALFDANTVYNKGGWMLHILRGAVRNDSLFFAALREYRTRHAYGTATTADFINDMNDVLGIDTDAYLHTFLYRTNRPLYTVSFGNGMIDGQNRTAVRIAQTQTNPDTTFRTRLELRFAGAANSTVIVENSEWQSLYLLDLGFAPTTLTVDPDAWVLRTITTSSLAPTILNSVVDSGNEAQAYSETLVGIGGTAPYTWSLLSGSLPDGIELSSGGILSGTPTEYGDFVFTARLRDNLNVIDTREFTLFIQGYPRVPQELTCVMSHPDSLTLCWRPAVNADLYEVYRSPDGDFTGLTPIASTPDTFFVDPITTDQDTIQFYQVISTLNP
jgi:aminopeptidase N